MHTTEAERKLLRLLEGQSGKHLLNTREFTKLTVLTPKYSAPTLDKKCSMFLTEKSKFESICMCQSVTHIEFS